LSEIERKFDVSDVKDSEGITIAISHHFKGFPAVASIAKLSVWQSDVKKSLMYTVPVLGKAAVAAASTVIKQIVR
jgi:hypothetical protein